MSKLAPIEISPDIFKKLLSAVSDMYASKRFRLFIKPRVVEVEIDDSALNEIAERNNLETKVCTGLINFLCNMIMAIYEDELDVLKDWLDKRRVYVYKDFDELVQLARNFLEQHSQIGESYNFYKFNLGNVLRTIDWQINTIKKSKKDTINIESVKIAINYYSSDNDFAAKSIGLDLCASDVDYIIQVFLNIKKELELE